MTRTTELYHSRHLRHIAVSSLCTLFFIQREAKKKGKYMEIQLICIREQKNTVLYVKLVRKETSINVVYTTIHAITFHGDKTCACWIRMKAASHPEVLPWWVKLCRHSKITKGMVLAGLGKKRRRKRDGQIALSLPRVPYGTYNLKNI